MANATQPGVLAGVKLDPEFEPLRPLLFIASAGYPMLRLSKTDLRLLHRLVAGAPPASIVDHVNRDRLDCRRENLRLVDWAQQNRNRLFKTRGVAAGQGKRFSVTRNKRLLVHTDDRVVAELVADAIRRGDPFSNPHRFHPEGREAPHEGAKGSEATHWSLAAQAAHNLDLWARLHGGTVASFGSRTVRLLFNGTGYVFKRWAEPVPPAHFCLRAWKRGSKEAEYLVAPIWRSFRATDGTPWAIARAIQQIAAAASDFRPDDERLRVEA